MLNKQTDPEILEKISAVYDGEELPQGKLPKLDPDAKQHLQNWSLIGSALRHELPEQIDLNFADRVMAAVEKTQPDLAEQPVQQLPVRRKFSFKFNFRKAGLVFSQLAVAASVAAVTVIGWQTYNAGSIPVLDEPAPNAVMGTVGGLSLASYQNDSRDLVINMNNLAQNPEQSGQTKPNPELLKQMQQKELDRINNYVRGFILHSAAE